MYEADDYSDRFSAFGDVPFHLSVDLDSTLCDTRHRKGIIEKYVNAGLPIDWDEYSRSALKDTPTGFAYVLQQVQYAIPWHVTSGRSAEALDVTTLWLERHKLKPVSINLEDSREAHLSLGHVEWKVQRIIALAGIYPIKVHIDDWDGVASLLEERTGGAIRGMTVTPPGMKAYFPDAVQLVENTGESPAKMDARG